MNDDSRKIALMRPRIVRGIQKYCDDQGFVEVETSIFSPVLGGAAAKPFITHFNALDKDFYLRIATELNLKKCMEPKGKTQDATGYQPDAQAPAPENQAAASAKKEDSKNLDSIDVVDDDLPF